jgi:hypothetical protein
LNEANCTGYINTTANIRWSDLDAAVVKDVHAKQKKKKKEGGEE